jgi:DNA repair protein RadC
MNAQHTTIREVQVNYKAKKKTFDKINGPDTASSIFRKLLPNNSQEHFIALYLDGANVVIGYSIIGTGTANQCTVHPREIFQRAVLLGACYVIVAHNHPSGSIAPSNADYAITKRIKESGELLGIPCIDSMIVTDDDYHSIQ